MTTPKCICAPGALPDPTCEAHRAQDFGDDPPTMERYGPITAIRSLRRRANISTSVKGIRTYDITVDALGFTQDEMLAELQVGSAAGEDGRAIGQVMDRADVRSEGDGGVVEEARSVGFFRGLESVDQAGQ